MTKDRIALLTLSAVLLMAVTAGASVYLTKNSLDTPKVATVTTPHVTPVVHHRSASNVQWDNNTSQVQAAPVQTASACNDDNIAGKAVGGVAGGVGGSLLGKGKGKTATTIAGTLAGAYAGGEVIPLKNATCR